MASIAIDDAAWASPWRRRRVGEKLAWSLGLILTALVAPVVPGTLLVGVVSVVVILVLARIRVSMLLGAMSAPLVFIVIGAVSVLVSVSRDPIDPYWQVGLLSITPASVEMSLGLMAHGTCGTLAVMVLALTTPISDLLTWLEEHRVPGALVEVASLTYRLLFILLDTAVAIHDAQQRRGGRLTVSSVGAATGTLVVRAWDRARRLDAGLAARGAEQSLRTTAPLRPASPVMWWSLAATIAGIILISYGVSVPWPLSSR